MIQCPNCRAFDVHEERHVSLPSEQPSGCWMRVLQALKTGMPVIVMLYTLGVVGLVVVFGRQLPEEGWGKEFGSGCSICVATTMLFLFPFIVAKSIPLVTLRFIPFVTSVFKPAGELPRVYRRTCESCGYEWTWKPGEPQPKVHVRPDLIQRGEQEPEAEEERPRPAAGVGGGARQPFICPECGHRSTYDPWVDSARCPQCGFAPPTGKHRRRYLQTMRGHAYQPFLDELLSHWNSTHTPDPAFSLETPERAIEFFRDYQRALGEDPHLRPGHHVTGFVRNYHPRRKEILSFAGAILHLRRGDRATAARYLQKLARFHSRFADPWLWLTATTDDPAERQDYLNKAVHLEPAHPLALDALAIARGEVSPTARRRRRALETEVTVARCPRCGGALHYEPGATEVECPYCGHQLGLEEINLLEEEALLVSTLRLQRRYQGHPWEEVERVVRCRACGAELTMTHHLARQCAYCGSASVLVEKIDENGQRTFEQPDGFLPFKLNRRQAADAIRKAQRSGLEGFKTWWSGRKPNIRGLQGIYVPFWVFDGVVEPQWLSKDGTQTASSGPDHRMTYDNMPFPGVDVPPPSFLDQVHPFDLNRLVPYESRLLADWPAQLYNLDVEVVVEDAYDTMLVLGRRRAGPPVKVAVSWNSPAPSETRRSFQVSNVTYQLVLLPVWVVLLRTKDERSLALVNGQTGKVVLGLVLPRTM